LHFAFCLLHSARRTLHRLHRNQSGTMSIVSVFALMLLAMLLGMVMNVGRQVDGKIKMQNAADAASYSGGVVLARGMNTLAFTNHLLCDVFALTAFMREARDGRAASLTPPVLAAWAQVGPVLEASPFPKFQETGRAINQKVPLEEQMVQTYSDWAAAASDLILPVLEEILAEEQIPEFQRALVLATPTLAQRATAETARRHGLTSPDRGDMYAVLWRTMVDPVGGNSENSRRTLPVVDPVLDREPNQEVYQDLARLERRMLAHRYLRDWNNESMRAFDRVGKMSQFANLWRGFTCGELDKLLDDEYPNSNLPHMIRMDLPAAGSVNQYLERDFMFVGVAYWPQLDDLLPGLFTSPIPSDATTFGQVMLFVPEPRLVKARRNLAAGGDSVSYGGVPGDIINFETPVDPGPDDQWEWTVVRQGRPRHWDLLNQNWTVQLVPATSDSIASILQTMPGGMCQSCGSGCSSGCGSSDASDSGGLQLPALGSMTMEDLRRINTH
jgi:hypothetical protein